LAKKEEKIMKHKLVFSSLLLALSLASAPTARAITTWYVNGVKGSDSNNCMSPVTACRTIGHAISLASSGDSILVAPATYKEIQLTISISLRVIGTGTATTIVDGHGAGTVFQILSGGNVYLIDLIIRGGNGYSSNGGGVVNLGTLTIINSTISGNSSFVGGGISNFGTLTVDRSTLSGNVARHACVKRFGCGGGRGGAVFNAGQLTINNSTLAGNSAYYYGGGIFNDAYGGGTLTINNGTLSGNSANTGGGIYIYYNNQQRTATLQNSIVANNSSGNCSGSTTSNGYNLSSDGSCNFSNSGDRNNTDPKLGPLQNNGGPTFTMALLPRSPAIDAGNPSGCKDSQGHLLTTDQRGMPRPDKEDTGGCDMGAYERQSD
jgi:hypothetical protein